VTQAAAFLFGKLPAHGDFVSRGLAPADRDALDHWLAASLADAQQRLGAGFADAYDRAPPWRFAWPEADGRWTAGAIAPSVDGVGRRYPIAAAARGVESGAVAATAAAAESMIYDALAGGWSADTLLEKVVVALTGKGAWQCEAGWWAVGADGDLAARIDEARPATLMHAMLTIGGAGPDMGREGVA